MLTLSSIREAVKYCGIQSLIQSVAWLMSKQNLVYLKSSKSVSVYQVLTLDLNL